jgi:hypothetical protein
MSDTTSPRAIFTKELVRELNRLEAFAKLDFRIPGTSTRLDVYIASPVRAFVEVIFLNVPHPSVTQGLIQQAALNRPLNYRFDECSCPAQPSLAPSGELFSLSDVVATAKETNHG